MIRSSLALSLAYAAIAPADSNDAAELQGVVSAYHHAIGENRLDEAMTFFHQHSPQAELARKELALDGSAYLHRTATLSFNVVHHDGTRAFALATHLHRKIAGIKFIERLVETRYVLRRQGTAWKIWTSVDQSP